ncbi:hypothetical protein JTB14_037748 [Gonioctena quinquepunctata]|nr:hypothetical protein JTB14_037748 [Gonioctena quinquepunctata]
MMCKNLRNARYMAKPYFSFLVDRGLDSNPTSDEVKEHIQQMKILRVFRSFLMITTPRNVTLSKLEKTINVILNQKITWELRKTDRPIVQCHRCQRWGHVTTNCFAQVRCPKCAQGHWTKDCKKSRNTPESCVNITQCAMYLKRPETIEERKPAANQAKTSKRPLPQRECMDEAEEQVPEVLRAWSGKVIRERHC